MNLEEYIISMYDIGLDLDRIVDNVYDKLSNSYHNRYTKSYAYISFGKVTRKECQEIVMSTIFNYVRFREEIRKDY